MWPARWWNLRFWAGRYWPKVGLDSTASHIQDGTLTVVVTAAGGIITAAAVASGDNTVTLVHSAFLTNRDNG
jgi:hypothetical protein